MNHKYLILLLFIFLVFLMGSVNSTVTNVFYNNTTGTEDHALLTNLSYDDSSHTGFQSSAALNDNVSSLGYVKDISGKLNKSGMDTITGYLRSQNASGTLADGGFDFENALFTGDSGDTGIFDVLENTVPGVCMRSNIGRGYNTSAGTNTLGKYWDNVGYSFQNCAYSNATAGRGLRFRYFPYNSVTAVTWLTSNEDNTVFSLGNLTVTSLAGSGNDYSCLDSAGKFYRDPTGCS